MTHLTDDDLVDLMDGALPERRRAHLAGCAVCRARARDLDWTMERVVEAQVPEPSPLFWDHLSARIRDAVASPEVAAPPGRGWWPRRAWAAGLISLACILAVALVLPGRPPAPQTAPTALPANLGAAAQSATADGPLTADDIEADQAWAVVRAAADRVTWDEAHAAGISPRPDAAERMALELTTPEQAALADLLERALKRGGT